jgi:hypothetical protein
MYPRTIPANIWSNLVQRFQRSLNVKAYDKPRTNNGHQVMAKNIMTFRHVSLKATSYYAIKTKRRDMLEHMVTYEIKGNIPVI